MAESYTVPYFAPDSNPYFGMFKRDKTLLIKTAGNAPSGIGVGTKYDAFSTTFDKEYTFALILEGTLYENYVTGTVPNQNISGVFRTISTLNIPTAYPKVILNGRELLLDGNLSLVLEGKSFKVKQYYGNIRYQIQSGVQTWTGVYAYFHYPVLIAFFE